MSVETAFVATYAIRPLWNPTLSVETERHVFPSFEAIYAFSARSNTNVAIDLLSVKPLEGAAAVRERFIYLLSKYDPTSSLSDNQLEYLGGNVALSALRVFAADVNSEAPHYLPLLRDLYAAYLERCCPDARDRRNLPHIPLLSL